MRIVVEEGYKTTPVLVFLYGKNEEFKFRITPKKSLMCLQYLGVITEYAIASNSKDPMKMKEFEARIAELKAACDKGHKTVVGDLSLEDDIKEKSASSETKIEITKDTVTFE